jgi:uncharacterized lipoprotein YajG
MKKLFIIAAAMLMTGTGIAAEDVPLANLKFSPELGKARCAAQPGKGVTLAWQGAADTRAEKAVGTLKVRSKEESNVNLAGSVDSTFGEAVKTVLKNCGFTVEDRDADGVKASVDVTEFFAGSKKGFFTGETDAKGAMVLHFIKGGANYDLNLGATKSDKKLKKKKIQQLEEVLSGLLEEMAAQIGESPQLFEEIKKLADR